MESVKGRVSGVGQIIGPDGQVKSEFKFTTEAEKPESTEADEAKQEEVNHGSDT